MDVEVVQEALAMLCVQLLRFLQEPWQKVDITVGGIVCVSDRAGPVLLLVSTVDAIHIKRALTEPPRARGGGKDLDIRQGLLGGDSEPRHPVPFLVIAHRSIRKVSARFLAIP